MGTPACISAVFTKGNNFSDILLASVDMDAFQNGVYS